MTREEIIAWANEEALVWQQQASEEADASRAVGVRYATKQQLCFRAIVEEIEQLTDLLRSAHVIALRKGADTAWERFAASIQKAGIGSVTARVYRVLPSDADLKADTADMPDRGDR